MQSIKSAHATKFTTEAATRGPLGGSTAGSSEGPLGESPYNSHPRRPNCHEAATHDLFFTNGSNCPETAEMTGLFTDPAKVRLRLASGPFLLGVTQRACVHISMPLPHICTSGTNVCFTCVRVRADLRQCRQAFSMRRPDLALCVVLVVCSALLANGFRVTSGLNRITKRRLTVSRSSPGSPFQEKRVYEDGPFDRLWWVEC